MNNSHNDTESESEFESGNIFITSEVLSKLIADKNISIIKKSQKTSDYYNYFITPTLTIRLFNPMIIVSNPKYFVLSFEKSNNLVLLSMLKNIHEKLMFFIKSNYYIRDGNKLKHPIHVESEEYFTIRCSLPHFNNKYFIKCDFEDEKNVKFTLPRQKIKVKSIHLDIRNIWETNNKIGYNLEVKYINY